MRNDFIYFLGTGGSRHVMAEQLRSTGGIYFQIQGVKGIIDPGPGALTAMLQAAPPLRPEELEGIILSHGHIDHCNDVNLLIDAMTRGGLQKRGTLWAPEGIIGGPDQVLFNYLKPFLQKIEVLQGKRNYRLGNLTFSTSGVHRHGMETYGFSFDLPAGKLSFLTDTAFYPELTREYQGSRWLVINLVLEKNCGGAQHLDIDAAARIIRAIQPRTAVITHFGKSILHRGPDQVAAQLQRETGVENIIAAADGQKFPL